MAFSLGGLAGITGGYNDATSKLLDNALKRTEVQQAQDLPAVQGLQGDMLTELANSGLLGGGPGAGGGGAPAAMPTGQGQAGPQGAAPMGGLQSPGAVPSAGGGPPSIPGQSPAQAADPNNPANWTSFQVAQGPGQGTGGQLSPGAPPSASAGPGAAPPGVTRPSGAPPGGPTQGQNAAPNMPQGPLTLQAVIQAAQRAAAKSGGKATQAQIARAVQGFVPLMNAQAQQQWRELSLGMREQQIQLQEQRAQESQRHDQANEAAAQQRIQLSQQRVEQAGQRVEQAAQRLQQAKTAEEKREAQAALRTAVFAARARSQEMIQAYGLDDDKQLGALLKANQEYWQGVLQNGGYPPSAGGAGGGDTSGVPGGAGGGQSGGNVLRYDSKTGKFTPVQ